MLNVDDRLLFQIDENELFLLLHVCAFWDGSGRYPFPSIETLANRVKWGTKKVTAVKKSLIEKGIWSANARYDEKGGRTSDSLTIETELIGVFVSMKGKTFIDESDTLPPKKGGTPPAKKGGTPTPQKGGGNTLTNLNTLTTEEVLHLASQMPIQKAGAVVFEKVGYNCFGPDWSYNWQARSGADFKALKTIRQMIEGMIPETDRSIERVNSGMLWVFDSGYKYLASIAEKKGGEVHYNPATIQRNFNAIIQHGKSIGKSGQQANGEHQPDRATKHDRDLERLLGTL
jgi:Helix-turn-helix domain